MHLVTDFVINKYSLIQNYFNNNANLKDGKLHKLFNALCYCIEGMIFMYQFSYLINPD